MADIIRQAKLADKWSSLKVLLAANQVVTSPMELVTYEQDASLDRGAADAAVFPRTTLDVVKIIRWAAETDTPVVARGAGTGLSGGAVAAHRGVIVGFSRMNRIIEFDESGRSVVVEPGVVNLALDEYVKASGLYYPPDPASGRSATTGGNIAENAGGPHCFKYGVTTNYITGLEVVLSDGKVVRLGGRAFDYPEVDLVGLITGSEGTLCLVTEASARLLRNAPGIRTALASFDSVEAAGKAVSAVIAAGLVPATMEMMDQKIMRIIEDYAHCGLPVDASAALIIEADGYQESVAPQMDEISAILRQNEATEIKISQTAEERERIWYGRKSAVGAMARLAPSYYLVDGTVPRSKLATVLTEINAEVDQNDLKVGYVFHAGDGNLHPFILIDDPNDRDLMRRIHVVGRRVMEICVEKGGSITGEHGVGIAKREYLPLMFSPTELGMLREVKLLFDPQDRLNPGKIFLEDLRPAAPQPAPGPAPASPFAPASVEEAASAIRSCVHAGRSIRVVGGGTKSAPDAEADVTFQTAALRGVMACELDDLYVTVGAGTRLSVLQEELARDRMWVPLVSPWSEATIGGIVAANANAPLRMRYGSVRDLVLAATVVLPDGRVIRAGRPVVKNVAGYDVTKLFVGTHGSLGLLADVSLKLAPISRARASIIVPAASLAEGLDLGRRLLRICLVSSALLLCKGCAIPGVADDRARGAPLHLIYTVEGIPEDADAELAQVRSVLKAVGAPMPAQLETPPGSEIWAKWMAAAKSSGDLVLRAGVAPKDLAGLVIDLEPSLAEASMVVDLASGFLYSRGARLDPVRRSAVELGGYAVALSGPAGDRWGYTPSGMGLMRDLKARWDPRGLFNPGAFNI